MSYQAEFFTGHWYDEGLRFATQDEARGYALSRRLIPYRVTPTEDKVNYSWNERLVPYQEPVKEPMSWEDFIIASGCGMPCKGPSEAAILAPGHNDYWGAIAFVHSSIK